jgi:hypothetical protein
VMHRTDEVDNDVPSIWTVEMSLKLIRYNLAKASLVRVLYAGA